MTDAQVVALMAAQILTGGSIYAALDKRHEPHTTETAIEVAAKLLRLAKEKYPEPCNHDREWAIPDEFDNRKCTRCGQVEPA
jgi:hypothetical protein